MDIVLIYLLIINALGFTLMLADKHKAKNNLWRIPEATLLWTAILGGSVGCLCAMHLIRHKTRHPKFSVGLPLILAFQIVLFLVIYLHCM